MINDDNTIGTRFLLSPTTLISSAYTHTHIFHLIKQRTSKCAKNIRESIAMVLCFHAEIATIIKYRTFSYTLSTDAKAKPSGFGALSHPLICSIPSLTPSLIHSCYTPSTICAFISPHKSLALALSLSLFVCTLFPVLFTARHFGMCMHKLFTCSVPSMQTVRINASQATLVSCVVFYYYAVIKFLSLPLFAIVVVFFSFFSPFYRLLLLFSLAWPRKSCL